MKKLLCMLLVAVMLLTAVSFSAFAEEITYAGEFVLGEKFVLGEAFGEYYSLTITEKGQYCFNAESYIYSLTIYLNGSTIFDTQGNFKTFELEPGQYDIQIMNYAINNGITFDKVPALESFEITKSQLLISKYKKVNIKYYFKHDPNSSVVSEYKYTISDTSVIEMDKSYITVKSVGEATLTVTAVDYYGNEFSDTVDIVVMPNVKWDLNEIMVYGYIPPSSRTLEFTVPETGEYRIYSTDDTHDPYAALYYNGEVVLEGDDSDESYDFEIITELTAGETYELLVQFYGGPGYTTVEIEKYEDPIETPIEVIPTELSLCVGDIYELEFENLGVDSVNLVTKESDSDDEAAVDAVTVTGKQITGVAEGEAEIECTIDGNPHTIKVIVGKPAELPLDQEVPVRVDEQYISKTYAFTAPEAGSYCFGTSGDADTCGILYDTELNSLSTDDDSGEGNSFYIEYEMEANQTVYINTYCYYGGENEFGLFVAKPVAATGIEIVVSDYDYFAFSNNVYYTVYDGMPDFKVRFLEFNGAKPEHYDWVVVTDENDPALNTVTVTTENGLTDSFTYKRVDYIMGDINLDNIFNEEDYLCFKEYFDNPDFDLLDAIRMLGDYNYDMMVERSDLARMLAKLAEELGHNYQLKQNGNVIDVICNIGTIECPDHSGTAVSVTAVGGEYTGEAFTATLTNLIPADMLETTVSEIYYVGTGDTVYAATTQAPTEVGTYKAYVTIFELEAYAEFEITKAYTLGDVNGNGKLDARDYLLLKRAYFGTYTLDETATLAGDINGNGRIDARDYLLLKRAYFGTYTIG